MEDNNVTIRAAQTDDIAAIMSVVREVVPLMQASGNQQWNDHYPNPEVFNNDIALGQLYVATVDAEVAGVVAHTTGQEPDYAAAGLDINQPMVVSHRLAVSPRFAGKGLAVALLKYAEEVARQKGITKLAVDTNTQNKVTQQLFPKLGYRLLGEIKLAHKPGLSFLCYDKDIQ